MSPKKEFIPYLFVFAAVFCIFSLLSFQEGDWEGVANWFGRLGYFFGYGVFFLVGKPGYAIGVGLLALGLYGFRKPDSDLVGKLILLPVLVISLSLAFGFLGTDEGNIGDAGGFLGRYLGTVLDFIMGSTGKAIATSFLFAYSLFALASEEGTGVREAFAFFRKSWDSLPGHWKGFGSGPHRPERKPPGLRETRDSEEGLDLPKPLHDWFQPIMAQAKLAKEKLSSSRKRENDPSWERDNREPRNPRSIASHLPDWAPPRTDLRVSRSQITKSYPRYKNVSLYEGFFEEERIFTFHETPVSLQRKYKETPDSASLGFTVLDFRKSKGEKDIFRKVEIGETSSDEFLEERYFGEDRAFAEDCESENDWENRIDTDTDVWEADTDPEFQEEFREDSGSESEWESKDFMEPMDTLDSEGFVETDEDTGSISEEISVVDSQSVQDSNMDSSEPSQGMVGQIPVRADQSNLNTKDTNLSRTAHWVRGSEKFEQNEQIIQTYVPPFVPKSGSYYISPRLLGEVKQKSIPQEAKADTDLVARKIEENIAHFGIQSQVISSERGPIITRYELTIPNGIKLSRITSLEGELRLYLAVKSIRIVAPIPGKSTIGIEVPNKHREDVFLTELLKDASLAKPKSGLALSIGKDISGKNIQIDITQLPHLLVAGTTGSGKSVCLNAMVTSLIYSRSPEELRFIMIDPKMVEMSLYEDIPHLLMPIITDPRKATRALAWAIQEMEARYVAVSALKCREFQSYNRKVEEWGHKKGYQKMPYIVIVIDELADLMMVSGKDLEDQIIRIAQKARAVGIHLVMATQRPSVDVITGLIKANCPARMAFQVAQKTDSRTILDANGAETLLGKGDFLYRSPTTSDLMRIQAPFVTETEIDRIVEEAKKMGKPKYVEVNLDEDTVDEGAINSDVDEQLVNDAWRIICQEGKASGSLIQRHLRIGYNRAANVIEILEKRGIISPQIGSKPREILKTL
jgi:S-DNA-T family DNA segregation ATPase FtsK/SpoIIIE